MPKAETIPWGIFVIILHLIINHEGDILAAKITPGNVDDREPLPELCTTMKGKLYGDKGYIGQALAGNLFDKGVELVTNVRKNMKAKATPLCTWVYVESYRWIDCLLSER